MRVLVACEYSGAVRDAFRALGHDAMSCDLLPTEVPGPHYQGDAADILGDGWDLLIAHPPCTYLCSSGQHWGTRERALRDRMVALPWADLVETREDRTEAGLDLVRLFMEAPIPRIAIENPIGVIGTRIRPADQVIQPWQFGHPESKATCLWLKGLPLLVPTNVLELPENGRWDNQTRSGQNKLTPGPDRWAERSRTYKGIAEAMANQWGGNVYEGE